MANEQVLSNYQTVAAYLAATMVEYYRTAVVMEGLISVEAPDPGSKGKLFRKKGGATAYIIGEAAQGTKSQIVDTGVTPTVQKVQVYFEPTAESEEFSGGQGNPERLKEEAGKAAAQKFDVDALALSSGFSNSSGTTNTTLTEAKLDTAIYKVRLSNTIDRINVVLHPTQVRDVRQAIIASTATFWSAGANQTLAQNTQPTPNGLAGKFLDADVFQSTNVPSANAGVDWLGLAFTKNAICCTKVPGFRSMTAEDPEYTKTKLSLFGFYGLAELMDADGCGVLSKQ